MADPNRSEDAPEITVVETRRVWCDGSGDIRSGANFRPAWLGHPRVFMQIDEKGYVDCGYCDRRFILEGGPADLAAGSGEHDERTVHELQPGELSDEGPAAID
jgi:uncharacterized Zn-finger protein